MLRVTQCRETGSNTVRPQEAEQQQASGQGSGGAAIGHDPADRVRSHSAPAAPSVPGGPAVACSVARRPGCDRRCNRSRAEEPAHGRGATHARRPDCGAGPGSGRMSAHRRTSVAPWPLAGGRMHSPAPRRATQARLEAPRRAPLWLCSLRSAHSSRSRQRGQKVHQAAQRNPGRSRLERRRSPKRDNSRTIGFQSQLTTLSRVGTVVGAWFGLRHRYATFLACRPTHLTTIRFVNHHVW